MTELYNVVTLTGKMASEVVNGTKPEQAESLSDSNFIKQLDLQLEILDDEEFHLPPVDELPTLESILNEEEEDPGSISDSENNISLGLPSNQLKPNFSLDCCDTASVLSKESSDSRSRASNELRHHPPRKESQSKASGSVLRHIVLKGVSAQLISAHERVGAGLPTTMAVSKYICIGTSHGLILVFEPSQALKWCLGSTQQGEQHGGVSALAVNQESSKLLAGFAKGHLCLFDLTNGKLLQNIPDAHTPFSAVLHIKWTDCPGLALISDSGGSVFELSIKRTMGLNSNESRCIFSGSRGEVCAIEPLIMGHFLSLPPVIDTLIIAMATISKMIVVSLRPHLKVLFSYPLKGASDTLPLLSWQFVIIQMPDGSKVIDPVLAFGRENNVYFYQLTHGSQDQLTFLPLQRMKVRYSLLALSWLNSRTLALIDGQETLHVIDVKNQEEMDKVDLAKLGLVYASPHFKAIATGGNVSRAMTVAGDRACYHSMITFGSQVLLLGTKSFQVVTMRTWLERVDHLVKVNCTKEALLWLLDILHEKAHAVLGLTHKRPRRAQLLKEKLQNLLELYLVKSITERPDRGNLSQLTNYFQNVVPCCVKVAVEADFKDILFTKIWDTFSEDSLARGIFLESLEPYILNDQIVDMSPSITQCLLAHHEDRGHLEAAEACIVHLHITSLDLHQAMTLCWAHGLYDAIFYVYTRGMKDYITPLEELLTVLKNALDSNTLLMDVQVSLGNKILVYISCCLAGRAYPHGDIDQDELKKVKHEVFKCITTLHTQNSKENEKPYPFLRTLLRFDTREFLNVLALAFEEEEFTTELGLAQRQRVVDILLQVMVGGEGFDYSQIGSLFIFIARQISRQGGVAISKMLIEQVLDHLTFENSEAHHDERQSALLEVIQGPTLHGYNHKDLISKAEKAQFYRVCEFLYEETGNHEKILGCYVKDKMRRRQVFAYIENTLTSPRISPSHKEIVKSQIVLNVKSLLQIDTIEVAKQLLSIKLLSPLILDIVSELESEQVLMYDYLQAIFATRSKGNSFALPGPKKEGSGDSEESACDHILFPNLQEKYIKNMCEIHPNQVYSYLQGAEGYRIEETLELCKNANLDEATAFLLERRGDIKGAFDIHLRILNDKINNLISHTKQEDSTTKLPLCLSNVQTQVMQVIKVCQLGSSRVEESERREMWFPLLDLILELQPAISNQNGLTLEVHLIIGHIVNSMVSHITLPAILERIIHSPGYSNCNFGQIKHLLKDMVERYSYEETLYSTVVRIIHGDQLRYLTQMKAQAASPLAVTSTVCALCKGLYHPASKAVVYNCGHSYHLACSGEDSSCVVCTGVSSGGPRGAASVTEEELKEERQPTQVKMDETQLDGLTRVSVLDTNTPRLSLFENLRRRSVQQSSSSPRLSFSSSAAKTDEDIFSADFNLKLAPPTLFYDLDDV